MKIAIGCDHAGVDLKVEILSVLEELGIEWKDFGTDGRESVDYPDFGERVSEAVARGDFERGILICGTGIGMSIVANKFPGIRASLCNDLFSAKMSRLHNDANLLILAGRIIGKDLAKEIVKTWFTTPFEGGRHQARLNKIKAIEARLKDFGSRATR
ncbi:MAG: ribose 5-phosphate isomerase B [Nitrospirae bacterium]|nr:ribose 5-phosphate isomerase B [Nitrospirota bacterium]